MVSPLSSRLLAVRGDSSSQSSSKGCRNSQTKRTVTGAIKTTSVSAAGKSIVSGYSADREGLSSVLPAVVSIDLHGRDSKNFSREASDCPKRRKLQEMQFAAASVKADLDRAGAEFKAMNKEIKESKCMGGDITIDLKRVRLMHSSEVSSPLVTSSVSQTASVADYEALLFAVNDLYPSAAVLLKSFETTQAAQDGSSDGSTSSVSDTESDSGSDNVNNANNRILFIPPLLEDALHPNKFRKPLVVERISPCNVISCASNATTMTDILQISTEARLVTKSSAPYVIIHANAAFLRLQGKKGKKAVLGTPFLSLLDPNANAGGGTVNLTNCMVSSSMGNGLKFYLIPKTSTGDPVECTIRVSPIVSRKTESKEVTTVTHFAVELATGPSIRSDRGAGEGEISAIANAPACDLPVGVMG